MFTVTGDTGSLSKRERRSSASLNGTARVSCSGWFALTRASCWSALSKFPTICVTLAPSYKQPQKQILLMSQKTVHVYNTSNIIPKVISH